MTYIEFYTKNCNKSFDNASEFIKEFTKIDKKDWRKADLEEIIKWWDKSVCRFKSA